MVAMGNPAGGPKFKSQRMKDIERITALETRCDQLERYIGDLEIRVNGLERRTDDLDLMIKYGNKQF